jgi:hypothetical protein
VGGVSRAAGKLAVCLLALREIHATLGGCPTRERLERRRLVADVVVLFVLLTDA